MTSSKINATVLCHFYNEEYLLPFWLKHHHSIFTHGIMIDYHSTDKSVEIIKELCPTWEIRTTKNEMFDAYLVDKEVMEIEETLIGFKIVLNVTEFIVAKTEFNLTNDLVCIGMKSYTALSNLKTSQNEVEFIMIDNDTQVEKLMSSGSGYEKTIASLALRSVLSKVCSLPKPNINVMDEVFGKISNDNLDMVYEFFVKIKDYFEKIFVITHNPLITNWADNIIRITKENNISRITQ